MNLKKAIFNIYILLFLLTGSNLLFGNSWYTDKIIEDIKINGLKNISIQELEPIISQYIGGKFTDNIFWDLQGRLYALDFFEDLLPRAIPGRSDIPREDPLNTVIIEFDVVERPVVNRITISGNRNLRRNQILDVTLLKPGDLINQSKIRIDRDSIIELYIEKGFPNITVTSELGEPNQNNETEIIFTVEEGSQTKISEIRFTGNNFAADSTLRRVIKTRRQSLFSKGLFLESKIREDIERIEDYYRQKGYIDARVIDFYQDFEEAPDDDGTNMIITFDIIEGEQYTFGGVSFEGNIIFKDDELYSQIRLAEGDVLDKTLIEADFGRIADFYYDDGYIFNIITRDEIRNEEEKSVFYRINIIEQGRAHIENIIIRGNDKTRDHVITRELPLEVGDIFSKRKIIEGITNLHNLQYFSVIEPETPPGSVDGLMDLILNVEEGKTTDVQFGLTFTAAAGDLPIMSFIRFTDRNFLGKGQELSIGTELSGIRQKVTLGFRENWLAGRRWSGGVTLSVEHETTRRVAQDILPPVFPGDDLSAGEVPDPYTGELVDPKTGEPSDNDDAITDYEYARRRGILIPEGYLMEYDLWAISLGINTGYTWHTHVGRFNASTGFINSRTWIDYDDEIYRPYNATVRDNFQEWQTINKLWYSFSWDTRDIVHNPTKGFYLKQMITYAGGILPSKRNYISTTSTAEYYKKLFSIPVFRNWEFKTIFAAHSSLSLIWNQFDGSLDITTEDMFYIDGMTMARGWPRVYDGKALLNNWVELRMPIFERILWWDWFLSRTGIWPERELFTERDKNDYFYSLGGGFRLTIPGLPIGFYFTKRFQYIDDSLIWYDGPLFGNSMKLDFVIGFTPSFF